MGRQKKTENFTRDDSAVGAENIEKNAVNIKQKRNNGFKLCLAFALTIIFMGLVFISAGIGVRVTDYRGNSFMEWFSIKYRDTSVNIYLDNGKINNLQFEGKSCYLLVRDDYDSEPQKYTFISEDMQAKTFTFTNAETADSITINFEKVYYYKDFVDDKGWLTGGATSELVMFHALTGVGLLALGALQTVAAVAGRKTLWANNLSIALGALFCVCYGLGALGIVGGVRGGATFREVKKAKKAAEEQRKRQEAIENKLSTFTGGAFMNAVIDWTSALVSILTLGICYPFMACWKLKWKASNTFIDGRQQAFDGNGGQFMGRYMLLMFLSVITLGIYYILCAKVAMEKWRTLHTRFADEAPAMEQAGEKLSVFDGKWYQLLGVNWLCNFVTLITLSFGQYWAHCYKERWFCKHRTIDGERLVFDGKAGQYFGKRILWLLLTVITFGVYVFWLKIKTIRWTVSHTHIAV